MFSWLFGRKKAPTARLNTDNIHKVLRPPAPIERKRYSDTELIRSGRRVYTNPVRSNYAPPLPETMPVSANLGLTLLDAELAEQVVETAERDAYDTPRDSFDEKYDTFDVGGGTFGGGGASGSWPDASPPTASVPDAAPQSSYEPSAASYDAPSAPDTSSSPSFDAGS